MDESKIKSKVVIERPAITLTVAEIKEALAEWAENKTGQKIDPNEIKFGYETEDQWEGPWYLDNATIPLPMPEAIQKLIESGVAVVKGEERDKENRASSSEQT
jgi:hypothetical protein